jgi:hypothetical protein
MAGKDFANAADKIKRKKELLKLAVPMKPDAPENIRLSKAEFVAKRRHEKEEASAVEQFKKDFRAKKVAEDKEKENGVQEEKGEEEVEIKKKGRPKKVE